MRSEPASGSVRRFCGGDLAPSVPCRCGPTSWRGSTSGSRRRGFDGALAMTDILSEPEASPPPPEDPSRTPPGGGPDGASRLSMMVGDSALDAERRSALRRMRTVAVGLLLLAATVYLLTLDREGFLGFVNAGAEASMVGAIADWFAVVALFKHPLGLPIPHTALVPKRKEMFGRGLEEFVTENFMSEGVVRSRVLEAQPARGAGDWLAQEQNARRLVREAAYLTRLAL